MRKELLKAKEESKKMGVPLIDYISAFESLFKARFLYKFLTCANNNEGWLNWCQKNIINNKCFKENEDYQKTFMAKKIIDILITKEVAKSLANEFSRVHKYNFENKKNIR